MEMLVTITQQFYWSRKEESEYLVIVGAKQMFGQMT